MRAPRFFSNIPGADKKVLYHKYTGPKDPNPEFPGKVQCLDPYDNTRYDVGDVWADLGQCHRKTCREDGTVVEERCLDDLEHPKECKEIKDMDFMALDYPWCCPRIACPGDEFYIPDEYDLKHYCFDKNKIRKEGETWTDKGKCNLNTCHRYDEVRKEKCPKYKIPRGCAMTEPDLTKEFPHCCPTVSCPPGKGPADGKFEVIKKVERPISINECTDMYSTTVEIIRHPDGIKPREDYDESEEDSNKPQDLRENPANPLTNSKEIKEMKKEKEITIEEKKAMSEKKET